MYGLDARGVQTTIRATEVVVRVSQPTCAQSWSELLLALPEFTLTHAHVDEHDELIATVQLPRDVQACPRCGLIELHTVHVRRWHTVRHLPVAGRATRLRWRKRLLACDAGCGTFVERTPSVALGAVWSKAAARMAVAMAADNIPIGTIRKAFGVGWNTVMRAVIAAAELIAVVRPTRVGIDETVMVTGRLTTRRREFLTALVCLETSLVVAVTQGRDRASAVALLSEHAPDAQVVALDLYSGFKSAADTIEGPTVVADVFHLVRLRCRRWTRSGAVVSSSSTATATTSTIRCSSCDVCCVSPRSGSTRRPGRRPSSGCVPPTPTTRSVLLGSRSICCGVCTPLPTVTPPTVGWSRSTSGWCRSRSPS